MMHGKNMNKCNCLLWISARFCVQCAFWKYYCYIFNILVEFVAKNYSSICFFRLNGEFITTVQQLGAAIIKGTWVSMGVYSDSSYDVPSGVIFSYHLVKIESGPLYKVPCYEDLIGQRKFQYLCDCGRHFCK